MNMAWTPSPLVQSRLPLLLLFILGALSQSQPQLVLLLSSQGLPPVQTLNASLSMPAYTLPPASNTSAPPTIVPALSFEVPRGYVCSDLVVNVALLRFYTRTSSTFRMPGAIHFWLWSGVPTLLNQSLFNATFPEPESPGWSVRNISATVAAGYEMGVQRFTLALANASIAIAPGLHWLGMSVAVNNSNNTVRWLVSNAQTLARNPYVITDAYGTGPGLNWRVLRSWAQPTIAEPLLMPSPISSVSASASQALAASVSGSCRVQTSTVAPSPVTGSVPSPTSASIESMDSPSSSSPVAELTPLPAAVSTAVQPIAEPPATPDPVLIQSPTAVSIPVPSPHDFSIPVPVPVPIPGPAPVPVPVSTLIQSPSPSLVVVPIYLPHATEFPSPSAVIIDEGKGNGTEIASNTPTPALFLSPAGWFGFGLGTGAVLIACVVASLWMFVALRRRSAKRAGPPRLIRNVDVEKAHVPDMPDRGVNYLVAGKPMTGKSFLLVSEDPDDGDDDSADDGETSATELVELDQQAEPDNSQGRYMDTPDALYDSYEEKMMQSVPLDGAK